VRGKRIFETATLVIVFASLFAIPTPVKAETAKMLLVPDDLGIMDPAQYFTLSVYVADVTDMYAWQFKVKYNPYALTFIAPPREGPFLKTGGFSTFFVYYQEPSEASVTAGATRTGEVWGVSGTGKIAEMTFRTEAGGAGKIWPIDLNMSMMLDSNLQPIPQLPPGDSKVQIGWPEWLFRTELWLSAAKGGKIWTEWQTGNLVPNPLADPNYWEWQIDPYWWEVYWQYYPWIMPDQTIYLRVRNTGTAGIWIRAVLFIDEMITGGGDAKYVEPKYIDANSEVILTTKAGMIDLYLWFMWPYEDLQQFPTSYHLWAYLQVSIDGGFPWYSQGAIKPRPAGDWYARSTPGGDTGKFKTLPP